MSFFFEEKDRENKKIVEQTVLAEYNRYYRMAYSYVHNNADACDIVQNGAYKAIKNSGSLKKPEFAQTWVYRIMLNECFKFLKSTKALSYEAAREEMGNEIAYKEDCYADFDLHKTVDMLPDKDKAVIILKYFEDKKLDEISLILDENISTIKSRLYRSLGKMRAILSEDSDEERKYN